ncbi:uncharacterized protein LOC126678037 [Mercurialis annua]|uniref:uncharacterized protein LOC126678037 n=1 Tax=Mercurialis annua TaxID=3986 RepID=UPI00215E844B|nr:uncharacterized protein LOC126678037 [Mercurialis annua]
MVTLLQVFSTTTTKSPSSSSTLSTVKIKTLIHTIIISHVCRIVRALSKAKAIIIQIFKENQPINFTYHTKRKHKARKILFGSFRLHYNWCSSHVIPVSAPVLNGISSKSHLFYDSTWKSIENNESSSAELSGYLHWLEQKKLNQEKNNCCNNNGGKDDEEDDDEEDDDDDDVGNEIDQLADMFIADCHEKFKLEKQESYRRFQEMMARSM